MSRRNIFQSTMAAGLAISSVLSTLTMSASMATANQASQYKGRETIAQSWPIRVDDRDWRNDRDWKNDRDWRDDRGWRNDRDGRRGRLRLSSGTSIPTRAERRGRLVLRRGEQYAYQLITSQNLRSDRNDRIVIPRGSTIYGELVPYRRGYRFESQYVTLRNGGRQNIDAVSDLVDTRDRYDRDDRIYGNPNLSPAASIILGTLLGRSGRTDSGILGGIFDRDTRARRDLVVIYPNRDLDLRLSRDFEVSYR